MGQTESKKKIQEQFQIERIKDNGDTLLKSKKDDKDYLMRIVSCSSQGDLDRLKTLLENRAQITNNHLLGLVQIKEKELEYICSIQYRMYLVLEYSFKNTQQEISERTKTNEHIPFQESDLWSILYSCCTALQTLYSCGVSHEALTSQQIFINKEGFVKIAEPLLFGLQKNHMQAMRTKDDGRINVHLSPQIMNCLEDQNFFYYQKQRSDIFILGMILVDLALLEHNYLYDAQKKKPQFQLIPVLLKRVGERYSANLTSILAEMLRVDSKSRPGLSQIIDRVEKCNNIGEDFTLETQSNLKSNDISSDRDHEKETYEKPAKYRELEIKDENLLDQSQRSRTVSAKIIFRGPQQPSFSINEQITGLNPQNFQGRVFNTTQQSNFTITQKQISNCFIKENPGLQPNQINFPIQPIQQSQPIHLIGPVQYHNQPYGNFQGREQTQLKSTAYFQTLKKSEDLYQRSKSIDSIKMAPQLENKLQSRAPYSATKTNPFSVIEGRPFPQQEMKQKVALKPKNEPLFTYEIPQVYNIMIKNTRGAPKAELFSNQEKNIILDKEHVSTPQFSGEITKANRFTSFKNYPHETVSRFSDDKDPDLNQIDLRRQISHTQSQTNKGKKTELDVFSRNVQSPTVFPSNLTFMPQNDHHQNPHFSFSAMPPMPFSGSAAASKTNITPSKTPFNATSSVSCTFSPSKQEFGRQSQSYTCRSGFNHLTDDHPDSKVDYVKEDIPDRGRYEGYKSNGMRAGHGILSFKDGGHYQGEWKQDKMHGFGKLFYENGTIAYEGHWQNDEFNGQGRVYNMEPSTFHQDFNYRDFSELGNRWIYYDGLFKNDSKHGKGYIKLTNGQMFEGLFDHDMIEGNGIFYKRTGEIIVGFWIDNKLFLNQSYEHEKK